MNRGDNWGIKNEKGDMEKMWINPKWSEKSKYKYNRNKSVKNYNRKTICKRKACIYIAARGNKTRKWINNVEP